MAKGIRPSSGPIQENTMNAFWYICRISLTWLVRSEMSCWLIQIPSAQNKAGILFSVSHDPNFDIGQYDLRILRRAKARFIDTGMAIPLTTISVVTEGSPQTYDRAIYFGFWSRETVSILQ